MAYDRYVAIANPLRYKIVMRWNTCTMLLGITWITSFIIGFILVYSVFRLPFCGRHEIDHFYCDVGQVLLLTCPNTTSHRLSELITFFTGFGLFTIPFLLLVTSYVYIISAILKIRTNEGRRKAFSTCSSHLTVVVVEYACLGFIYFRPTESYSMDKDKVFVMTFTFVTPILNPVIYTVRNKAVKKGFMKLTSKKLF
ncbi:olfactory receptor 10R2-like [Pseudophryne corroboree]|uniref:olfactory receptor 10R2-like n=1 Tax=Pseudophryne corroboree TaxID=495146 RepID=UPI0030821B73